MIALLPINLFILHHVLVLFVPEKAIDVRFSAFHVVNLLAQKFDAK